MLSHLDLPDVKEPSLPGEPAKEADQSVPILSKALPEGIPYIDSGGRIRFPVMEIFGPTLQGEGHVIGMQTMFIRFGGCDYRCKMCDSLHSVLPSLIKKGARWLTVEEIVKELSEKAGHCKMVTLSGGNPLMWDLKDLVLQLMVEDWTIAVETQGSIFRPWVQDCDYVTISPKGPGMGERFELDKFNYFVQQCFDPMIETAVKIVIFGQEDIEFAKQISALLPSPIPLYLSLGNPWPPTRDGQSSDWGLSPDIHMKLGLLTKMSMLWEDVKNEPTLVHARFLPQMHVLLWANKQGV